MKDVVRKRWIVCCALASCIVLVIGWYLREPNTFTFTVDMPSGFRYKASVYYVPAPGEICTVDTKDNKAPVFNYWWREDYKPDSKIVIRRVRNNCPLVVHNIKLKIHAIYGEDRGDSSFARAQIVVKEALGEIDKESFDAAGESVFYGECEWLFRTSGSKRRIVKLLRCKDVNVGRPSTRGGPVAGYTLDQLPGKTVKMKINVAEEERPAVGDTWVKFENGWKRCMGDSFEDQYAFCRGNNKGFSSFIMPDGKQCTIYPGCTE